jgi:outer membrane protein assembly factor BamB
MEGLVIYSVSRTPSEWSGVLVALDTETGREVWTLDMDDYAWSSPVAVYDANGTGYVVICDFGGTAYFLDGATGQVLDSIELDGRVEASPAVFNDMLVVGTKDMEICGIKIE